MSKLATECAGAAAACIWIAVLTELTGPLQSGAWIIMAALFGAVAIIARVSRALTP